MVLEPRDPPGRSFVGMQWLEKNFLFIIIATVSSVPTSKKNLTPPYENKVIQSDVPQAPSEDSSDSVGGSEIEFDHGRWRNSSGIDNMTCEYPEGDNSSISTY